MDAGSRALVLKTSGNSSSSLENKNRSSSENVAASNWSMMTASSLVSNTNLSFNHKSRRDIDTGSRILPFSSDSVYNFALIFLYVINGTAYSLQLVLYIRKNKRKSRRLRKVLDETRASNPRVSNPFV